MADLEDDLIDIFEGAPGWARHLSRQIEELKIIMSDLDTTTAALEADDTALIAAVDQLITIVEGIPASTAKAVSDALQAAGADEATQTATLAALDTAVQAEIAKAKAALPPPPAPEPAPEPAPVPTLSVSPATVTATVGSANTVPLSISGGTAPYALVSPPAGVSYDGTNLVFDASTVAFDGEVVINDSSTPPVAGSVHVTIA